MYEVIYNFEARTFNDERKKMLKEWIKDAEILLKCHLSLAERVKKRNDILSIVSIVVSVIVGSTILASAISDVSDKKILYIIGIFSLLGSILQSLLAYLKLPELSYQHTNTGNEYAAIRKELEFILIFGEDIYNKKQLIHKIQKIKIKWDGVRVNSVPISKKTIIKFKEKKHNKLIK